MASNALKNFADDSDKAEYFKKLACGGTSGTTNAPKITISTKKSVLDHIFRDAPGHLRDDTPANRALFENVANDPSCYYGSDKHNNVWFAQIQSDGTQVWVKTRGTVITDAGVNNVPKVWNPETGFCSPTRP